MRINMRRLPSLKARKVLNQTFNKPTSYVDYTSDRVAYIKGQESFREGNALSSANKYTGRLRNSFMMGFQAAKAVAERGLKQSYGVIDASRAPSFFDKAEFAGVREFNNDKEIY